MCIYNVTVRENEQTSLCYLINYDHQRWNKTINLIYKVPSLNYILLDKKTICSVINMLVLSMNFAKRYQKICEYKEGLVFSRNFLLNSRILTNKYVFPQSLTPYLLGNHLTL